MCVSCTLYINGRLSTYEMKTRSFHILKDTQERTHIVQACFTMDMKTFLLCGKKERIKKYKIDYKMLVLGRSSYLLENGKNSLHK